MDASEFKEFIFGMLFIKRLSDEFDRKRLQLRNTDFTHLKDQPELFFVNWWQQIRYDLKTIISTGWHHSLIPDDYLIAAFFQTDADAIEALASTISEAQSELTEAVEAAREVAGFELEEGQKLTAAVMKKALKELIDDLKEGTGASARKEMKNLQAEDKAIKAIEKRIKAAKAELKTKTDELALKLELKRIGGDVRQCGDASPLLEYR